MGWGGQVVGVVNVVTQSGHSNTLWIVPGTNLVEVLLAGTHLPSGTW